MAQFNIIYPSAELAAFVKCFWVLEMDSDNAPLTERTVPTGCIQLIFHRGKRLFSTGHNELQPQAFISGQVISYSDVIAQGHVNMIVAEFYPYGAKAFFPMAMTDFYGKNISLNDFNDVELKDLGEKVSYTSNDFQCIRFIEQFLLSRLLFIKDYNFKRIAAAICEINNQNKVKMSRLADIACVSTKQFNRIFTEHVGASPKEFARIVRFQRVLYILQVNPAIDSIELAYRCGYYDQAHLIHEFKTFSGYTPNEFLNTCQPHSDYFSKTL